MCEKLFTEEITSTLPQGNREIEYSNRTLKPFISYPGRKILENFHPKLPTDFQACTGCRIALVITMQDTCKPSFYQIMDTSIRKKAG